MRLLSSAKILQWAKKVESLPIHNRIWHFVAYGNGGRYNEATFKIVAFLLKDGFLGKIISESSESIPYPQGGGRFVGFIQWYRDALYKNEFRVDRTGSINRMPRNNNQGSETITDGLRIRVRTLYVPETDPFQQVTIAYEFELDCAPGQSPPEGILRSRHFEIGENGYIKHVNGDGVVGLYPRIGPGMEVFRWNFCKLFCRNSRDCWMQGSFLFRLASGKDFHANISKFYFKWRDSPMV